MALTATATIKNDINFTLIKMGANSQNESAALNYTRSLTSGTGSLMINYGVIHSGTLGANGKAYIDLRAMEKSVFDTTSTIQFSKIKSIVVENNETTYNYDINIHATGGTAFTGMFNGGSGALVVKPYGVHQYSDPISGTTVDASNRQITVEEVNGYGADYTIVVVGVTG